MTCYMHFTTGSWRVGDGWMDGQCVDEDEYGNPKLSMRMRRERERYTMMDDGNKSVCKKNDKRAQHAMKKVQPTVEAFRHTTYSTLGTADTSATPSRRPRAQRGSMGRDSPCGRAETCTHQHRAPARVDATVAYEAADLGRLSWRGARL